MTYNNLKQTNEYQIIEITPPSGFVLQKDVYITNILYASNLYKTQSLLKSVPFIPIPRKPKNPSRSMKIIREKPDSIENDNEIKYFKKKLKNKKLIFPLPKSLMIPLTAADFYKNLRDKNIKIKYMMDDLNINSDKSKKIFYHFKEQQKNDFTATEKKFPKLTRNYTTLENLFSMKFKPFHHMNKLYDESNRKDTKIIKRSISQVNNNLSSISKDEKIYKKIFFKSNLFTTQIDSRNCLGKTLKSNCI